MANRKILHKRTSGSTPTSGMLSYGEIAVNYGANKEALYIKSSKDRIAEFRTDDYNESRYLLNNNNVFTTFETEEEYTAAIVNGEIVAPNTSYIVEKKTIRSLTRMYQYNMKMVITQEWLNYWDENMTSQGVDHIYLCDFINSDWVNQQTDGLENCKGVFSDCITSFVVNGEECRHKFVAIPTNVRLNTDYNHPNNAENSVVGYAIPRNEVVLGETYDIYMEIVCEPFDIFKTMLGVGCGYASTYCFPPVYSIVMTEQIQGLLQNENQNIGLYIDHISPREIKYSGNFVLTTDAFTTDKTNTGIYTPEVYDHFNGFNEVISSRGFYNKILDTQAKIGIANPTLTVYLPNNNPTYGSPSDLWDGSTDSGKTAWGIHNYYLANKWNQSDFKNGVVDGPNLVAWKSNYTFNVVGYNDETYEG